MLLFNTRESQHAGDSYTPSPSNGCRMDRECDPQVTLQCEIVLGIPPPGLISGTLNHMQWTTLKSLNADSGSDWDNLSGYLNQAFPTFLISRPTYFYVWWTVAHLMSFPLFNVHNIIPTQNKDDKNKRCTFKLPSIWHHSSSQTSINFWSSGDHQESARGPKPMVEKGWPKQPQSVCLTIWSQILWLDRSWCHS